MLLANEIHARSKECSEQSLHMFGAPQHLTYQLYERSVCSSEVSTPQPKKMDRGLNLMHVIILGFAILSLIFLISGFATRGWIIYEMTIATTPGEVPYHDWQQHPEHKANLKFSITFGLWKGKACVMSKCTDLSYSQTAGIIFYDKGKTGDMS